MASEERSRQAVGHGLSEIQHVLILKGGMGNKQRQAAAEKLASIPDRAPRVAARALSS